MEFEFKCGECGMTLVLDDLLDAGETKWMAFILPHECVMTGDG